MTPFQIIAAVVTLSAIGSYLNYRYFKFPQTIGLMAFALVVSAAAIVLSRTGLANLETLGLLVGKIDFSEVLLHGMLSFLLFAGAMHINLADLNSVRWTVGVLATAGVIIATFITGTLVWLASGLVGLDLPYLYALLFGALISPTDPIAVLAILKEFRHFQRNVHQDWRRKPVQRRRGRRCFLDHSQFGDEPRNPEI